MTSKFVCKKNIKISKVKLSPKSYLYKNIFDKLGNLPKKRKKIKMEDFEVLSYNEYGILLEKNFNVRQLKSMLKFYKQKTSGNKGELIFLLYNYLKYSNHAILIQKVFRGHMRRYLNKLRGPGLNKTCVNETDFYTLEDIKDLNNSQFYSFKDKDEFVYGFDICSIYNMIVKEKQKNNPYNRNILPIEKIMNDIKNIIKLGKLFNERPNIKLENNINLMSKEKQTEMRAISIFQKIDECGFITDVKWYLNLSRLQLRRFISELVDVWQYRAQISNDTKRRINPVHGDPFFTVNMSVLLHKCFEVLQTRILDIIEIFITKGIDSDAKSLGTYYVLGCLTTVSREAAISLPWLYESFVQNQQ